MKQDHWSTILAPDSNDAMPSVNARHSLRPSQASKGECGLVGSPRVTCGGHCKDDQGSETQPSHVFSPPALQEGTEAWPLCALLHTPCLPASRRGGVYFDESEWKLREYGFATGAGRPANLLILDLREQAG